MLRAFWLAENGYHDDSSSHHRTTERSRSNSKMASSFGQTSWHSSLHHCTAAVSAVSKRRQPRCQGACPQNKTHARVQLIGACNPCRLNSCREGSIAQDWRSIQTRDLSHQGVWSWKRPLQVFTCPSSEMAFAGLTFDSNHVPGDYDFSLLTITEIVLQGILLLCSFSAVMFFAKKKRHRSVPTSDL